MRKTTESDLLALDSAACKAHGGGPWETVQRRSFFRRWVTARESAARSWR